MKKILVLTFFLSTLFFVGKVFATLPTPPNFPSCVNPQGQLIVSYNSGTHGVPGDPNPYQGNDSVYLVSPDSVMQCLCTDDGSGTQTNWWKVSSLIREEIDSLIAQGWIFIPDGSVWGLEDTTYLAKNVSFSCRSSGGGGGGGGSSSSSSSSGGTGGGSVGEVLGLAFTGNILYIYFFAVAGLVSVLLGLIKSKK